MDISDHNGGLGENGDEVGSDDNGDCEDKDGHEGDNGDAVKQNVKHIVGQLEHP